jgi:hypothetical protein
MPERKRTLDFVGPWAMTDERMLDEHRGDLRRRRRRHDEIEIAHDLLPAPITSRDADVERLGMRAQIVLQSFRFRCDLPELEGACVFLPFIDRGAKFFLRRLAEARQFRHAAGDACFVKLRDRANLQFLVKRLDFFRAKSRQREELENVRRKFRAQILEEFQRPGLNQFLDLGRDRLSDSRNFFQRLFVGEVGDIPAKGFERTRGVGVSADLERVLALQFEKRRDLLEHVRDRRLVHRSIVMQRDDAVIPRLAKRAEGPLNCNLRYRETRRRSLTEDAYYFAEAVERLRGPSPSAGLGMTRVYAATTARGACRIRSAR